MQLGIITLPWELLIHVLSLLNLQDFVNLKRASSQLSKILEDESMSREAVKARR